MERRCQPFVPAAPPRRHRADAVRTPRARAPWRGASGTLRALRAGPPARNAAKIAIGFFTPSGRSRIPGTVTAPPHPALIKASRDDGRSRARQVRPNQRSKASDAQRFPDSANAPGQGPVHQRASRTSEQGWPAELASSRGEPVWPRKTWSAAPAAGVLDRPVQLGKVVTVSPVMHNVLTTIARMARTDVTLTFIGETGTGKDVLAHLLHDQSPRRAEPFVVFDCSAVASSLVESEIFGHERGAFTGAIAAHAGAFERARGGTLFLDEVGELPLDLQPKLLRVLENRCFRRVGGSRDRPLDVRIVAATNRDLAALVAGRQFREDLYFRLAAAVVSLPPLRERLDDLPVPGRLAARRPGARRAGRAHGDPGRAGGAPLARQRPRAQERARLGAGLRRRRRAGGGPPSHLPPRRRAPPRSTGSRWAATAWRASSGPPSARPCARPAATRRRRRRCWASPSRRCTRSSRSTTCPKNRAPPAPRR